MKKIFITAAILTLGVCTFADTPKTKALKFTNPFGKSDYKSQQIKYEYQVQKDDLEYKKDNKIINRIPSGYMTEEEYQKQSEYKDPASIEYQVPKIEAQADFKYVPKPLYKVVKYNDPPGGTELALGKRLFLKRQINGQGIVDPQFMRMVYPAIYYYNDSASVASDLFVIPLNQQDNNLTRILKANVGQRNPEPILSTDKAIDNYAAFRTLTPVDFSADGSKLLAKEKLGSSEDGIWATKIYVYDFKTGKSYDLSAVRDAIMYYWKEYKGLNLIEKRWDIYPLGFDAGYPDRVVVQAYAYTGAVPVFLGTWSVDCYGEQSRVVSLNKNFAPKVSSNGYKIVKDGAEEYQTVVNEGKNMKKQDKVAEKQYKAQDKENVKQIKQDYKYQLRELKADYKDEYRDNKKLQTFAGSTEGTELEKMYHDYQVEQTQKDIEKLQKQIDKTQKRIDKQEQKIQKETDKTQQIMDLLVPQQDNTQTQTDGEEEFHIDIPEDGE